MPVTMWIIAINLGTWMAAFFRYPQPRDFLLGEVTVSTAWRCLTYPLGGVGLFPFFVLLLIFFGVFAGSLERAWGSLKFVRVFVVLTLSALGFHYLGLAVISDSTSVTPYPPGLAWPDFAMFVIWAAYNRYSTVLFMFVIPMQAQVMAWIMIVVAYFVSGPMFGLFTVATPILSWFWAVRALNAPVGGTASGKPKKSLGDRLAEKKRSRQKSRFKLLEGGAQEPTEPVATLRRVTPEPPKEDTELDRILDKIRFEGMESLTDAERATLDQKSQSLRGD